MNYGFKVSQPGYNVLTAAKENLVFSSQYNTLKIYTYGSGSIACAAGSFPDPGITTVTITHNMGYRPAFFCYCTNPISVNNDQFAPYTYQSVSGMFSMPTYEITTTTLIMKFYNATGNPTTFYYRYFIYYNQLP